MNRKKIVITNFVWEFGCYIFVMLLGFFAPKFIIKYYGSEVYGLQSTITQVINVILLLQSGVTTAAVYSLYKPIADSDFKKISEALSSSIQYYEKLALIFLALMLVASGVASFGIKTMLDRRLVLICFAFSGMKSFLDLFYCSRFRVIFSANQRKFLLSIGTLLEQIVYYSLLFFSIYRKMSFVYFNLWFLIGCLVKISFLFICYAKQYGKTITIRKNKSLKLKNRYYALINEVSHSVSVSSVAILISFMYGLKEASVFAVYYLVSQALSLILNSMYSAFEPSFANMVASGETERANKMFHVFQFGFVMLNTVLMMCMLFLVTPFVVLYTSSAADIPYENNLLALLLVLMGCFSAYRVPYNMLVSTCGFFKETWKQPAFTVISTLIVSVALGLLRFELFVLGPVVFYLTNFLYQHFRIKSLRRGLISNRVFLELSVSLFLLTGTGVCAFKLNYLINSFVKWIAAAVVFFCVSAVMVLAISLLLFRKELQDIKELV